MTRRPHDPKPKTSKVALVGYATSSRGETPWDDPEFEVWGLNMAHSWMPKWDRLFELHDRSTLEAETEEMKRDCDHLGTLKAEQTRPIYMLKEQPDIPMSIEFPIRDLTRFFSKGCTKLASQPYFTSTPSLMLAFAIYLGFQEIHTYGIDLVHTGEYAYQRANFEFLCGWALGHGITLHVPVNSAVFACDGIYGYENAESLALLSRLKQTYVKKIENLVARREAAATRREQAKADFNSYDGARQMLEELVGHIDFIMRGGRI